MISNNPPSRNFQDIDELDPEYWDLPELVDSDDENDFHNQDIDFDGMDLEIDPLPINFGLLNVRMDSNEIIH